MVLIKTAWSSWAHLVMKSSPVEALNNLGLSGYTGFIENEPSWVNGDFGNAFSANYIASENPALYYCSGITSHSKPYDIEACLARLREAQSCVLDSTQQMIGTFVWASRALMFGKNSTIFNVIMEYPETPGDALLGIAIQDPDTIDLYLQQSSLIANFAPFLILGVIGFLVFISLFIHLIWFCSSENCRRCWGTCCCNCCCNSRTRTSVPQLHGWKKITQTIFTILYFVCTLALVCFTGYVSFELFSPYRLNQTACRMMGANYNLAFGENSLLDVGTRLTAMLIDVDSNNHMVINMTGNDPIYPEPGVGSLNEQPYERMCPRGWTGPSGEVYDDTTKATGFTWKDAVGTDDYTIETWDQCSRYTPNWAWARAPYAAKYAWGRIAREYGRRAYYSTFERADGENHRFLYTDEYPGAMYSYVGYPESCTIEDGMETPECVNVRYNEWSSDGSQGVSSYTCRSGAVSAACQYNDMNAGEDPSGFFSGELNRPYEFYFRTSDRSERGFFRDENFGPNASDVLESRGVHHANAGYMAQGSVMEDILTGGSVENPSGLTTLLANTTHGAIDGYMDPSSFIGWIRYQCAHKDKTGMSLENFCSKTTGSEVVSTGLGGGFSSGWCLQMDDPSSSGSNIDMDLAKVLNELPYGRAHAQCIMGTNTGDNQCLFSDDRGLSNRKDICEVFLSRNVTSRSDAMFTIDNFVQYFRATPNAINSGKNGSFAVDVGHYPNTGNYNEATTQHTWFKDPFDFETADVGSILEPRLQQMITPASGEHLPFMAFNRLSNWIDSQITIASHETAISLGRQGEYIDFLSLVRDAVWVIFDGAMGILPILPVYAEAGDAEPDALFFYSTSWILFTFPTVLWILSALVWVIIGVQWKNKRLTSHSKAGCYARTICSFLFIGGLFCSLCFLLSSLLIPIIGEVALICDIQALAPLSLDGKPLPPLYEDLFGPAVPPHPNDDTPYVNSLAACVYQGTDFNDTSLLFDVSMVTANAGQAIIDNLSTVLQEYNSHGLSIDEGVLSQNYIPVWNPGDFSHWDLNTQSWTQRTKMMSYLDMLDHLETSKNDAVAGIQSRMEQVVVSTIRGLVKKTDGNSAITPSEYYINVSDSPLEPMMSGLVDEGLAVTYINDSFMDLDLSDEGRRLISEAITNLIDPANEAAHLGSYTSLWMGRRPGSMANGYLYGGSLGSSGSVVRPPDYSSYGDFYNSFVPADDWTADAAVLTHDKANDYKVAFVESNEIGTFDLGTIVGAEWIEETITSKYEALASKIGVADTIRTWDSAAHEWLSTLYGEDYLSKPVSERSFCYDSTNNDPMGSSPEDIGINIKDICVLSVRRSTPDTFFESREINTSFPEEATKWFGSADAVLMPVAGACVFEYQEWVSTLKKPNLDEDGIPTQDTGIRQALLDWHTTACTTLADTTTNPYVCIRPMRRMEQLYGGIAAAVFPDLVIEAVEDEKQIREQYSGLLPYHYELNKGRDARWSNPVYGLFADETLDITNYQWDYAQGLMTGTDFGIPLFGARTGIVFGSHGMPNTGFEDMQAFVQYRNCILGPDTTYPLSVDRANETQTYLESLPSMIDRLVERQSAYRRLLSFMSNTEMIQRLATMSHNYKARGAQAVMELGIVEDYYKMRDFSMLPTRESALQSDEDLVNETAKRIEWAMDAAAIVNNTAQCGRIHQVSEQSVQDICGGVLGLVSMIIWIVWMFSAVFLLFYCCAFKQMHYWIDIAKTARSASHSDETYHYAAYHGKNHRFEQHAVNKDRIADLDDQGNTCLHMAAFTGQPEVIENILRANPEIIDVRNIAYYTAIHLAVYENHVASVEKLCEYGADTSLRDEFGDTPLTAATRFGHVAIVDVLLDAGADPFKATRSFKFAEDIARMMKHHDVTRALEKHHDDQKKATAVAHYDQLERYSSFSDYSFSYSSSSSHHDDDANRDASIRSRASTSSSKSLSYENRTSSKVRMARSVSSSDSKV